MDKSDTENRFNKITHLVVAPYNSTTAHITNLVAAYDASNEAAIKLTKNNISGEDFRLFVVSYSSWDNVVLYWLIERYLAQ